MVLDDHQLMILHTATNQKHAGAAEASVERRFGRAGSRGEGLFNCYFGKRVNRIIERAKQIVDFTNYFFLGQIIDIC
jgi:hypothetical protein